MELNVQDWKEFQIGRLFEIYPTKDYKGLSNDELDDGGNNPFVINSAENNGIGGHCSLPSTEKGNIITFSDTTDGNTFFYQPNDFIGFAHVQGMHPLHREWNKYEMLFITSVLMFHNKGLFNYGRKMRRDVISKTMCKLPIQHNADSTPVIDANKIYSDDGYVPDWRFMEDYIKSLHSEPITTKISGDSIPDLKINTWEEFRVGDLFSSIYKAKAHTKDEVVETNKGIHFVSRTDINNGVDIVVKNDNLVGVEKANCITIGDTTATCYYQNEDFVAGDHMVVLRAEWMNLYRGLFIRTIFMQEYIRYCYGRAYRMELIKNTLMKLPIQRDDKGNPLIDTDKKYSDKGYIPDWRFMEDYMKSLPYSDRI